MDESSDRSAAAPVHAAVQLPFGRSLRLPQPVWIGIAWALTRLFLIEQLVWAYHSGFKSDVWIYRSWSGWILRTGSLPTGPMWQYPVGAALIFLIPHLQLAHFGAIFSALMVLCDLGITCTLTVVGSRERCFRGCWAWLAMTMAFGPVIYMRFDLAASLAAVAALAVIWTKERQRLFGVLVGLGVLIKVWPVLALLASRTRRKLIRAAGFCAATVIAVIGVSSIFLGNTLGFISHQSVRGLEVEAVAATPWFAVDAFTHRPISIQTGSGCTELAGQLPFEVASALRVMMLVLALVIAGWWISRCRRGLSATGARDAVFTAVLWYVIVSPVLSPQYMIWLMAVGALAICARASEMQRPVVLLIFAVALTRVTMSTPQQLYFAQVVIHPTTRTALTLVARNVVLLLAAIDAARLLVRAPRVSAGGQVPTWTQRSPTRERPSFVKLPV